MSQLALPLRLHDFAVFGSFYACGNETLVAHLEASARGESRDGCWLWGGVASGKTHLLQAVCEAAGDSAVYLPMKLLQDAGPEILQGLGNRRIVCLDDLGAVLAAPHWELALFEFCNQLFDAGAQLLVSAAAPTREAGIALPDLQSRLAQLPAFRINDLTDADRMAALQLRARHRGLDLPDETASYLLTRGRRDMASLYTVLDRLDTEALRAQRRLTVPFVRDVLTRD